MSNTDKQEAVQVMPPIRTVGGRYLDTACYEKSKGKGCDVKSEGNREWMGLCAERGKGRKGKRERR